MQYKAIKPSLFAALAMFVTACNHADAPNVRIEQIRGPALSYTAIAHTDPADPNDSRSIIQTIILKGSTNNKRTTGLHGVLLMRLGRPLNKAVCAALVSNLAFYDDHTPIAFSQPSATLRYTEIYDSRTEEELSQIARPRFLSKSDCDELVSNFDFARSYGVLSSLRIDHQGHTGPWLIAVDPDTRSILKFNLTGFQESELDDAMDQWIDVLHNRTRWPRQEKTWKEIILSLFGKKFPMEVVPLPRNFQE